MYKTTWVLKRANKTRRRKSELDIDVMKTSKCCFILLPLVFLLKYFSVLILVRLVKQLMWFISAEFVQRDCQSTASDPTSGKYS